MAITGFEGLIVTLVCTVRRQTCFLELAFSKSALSPLPAALTALGL